MIEHKKESLVVSGLALALLFFSLGFMTFQQRNSSTLPEEGYAEEFEAPDPFASLTLKARAAFVWDITRGQPLYALHEDAQLPLASLTKIMTALVSAEEKGGSEAVTITKDAVLQEGDQGFIVDETWRLKDLIDATLLTSSNDGAYALASVFPITEKNTSTPLQKTFIQKMNQKAKELGLNQTFFENEAGLDLNLGVSGAYGSARDLARLLEHILLRQPTLMEATTRALLTTHSLEGKVHNLENTNKLVETLPGIVASKTGTTDLAGGNLAIVFEAGPIRPIAIVILGSTAEERFTDAEKLMWASLKYLQR